MSAIRCYSELITIPTFEARLRYLQCFGEVGADTFGFDRYLNQNFYKSKEWKRIRDKVIIRDLGCDLGIEGYEIMARPLIHHLNPITKEDILNMSEFLISPEYLITTTHETHNLIHYGGEALPSKVPVIRTPNDTIPWR